MGYEQEAQAFEVGDIVVVVEEPYEDCPFSWVAGMTELCGKEVRIADVTRDHWLPSSYIGYRIEAVDGTKISTCVWCKDCFYPLADREPIKESDMDISVLFCL